MKCLLAILLASTQLWGGIPKDKQLHLFAGAVVAVPVYFAAKADGCKYPELWAIGAAFLAGLVKELHDRKQPGDRFDAGDLAATVAGGVVITFAIRW